MKLSVFAVLLADRSLDDACKYLKDSGVQAIEIGAGGFPGKAHCNPAELLKDDKKIEEFRNTIEKHGLEIAALSTHGNAVHPDPAVAKVFHDDYVNTVLLAEKLGVSEQEVQQAAALISSLSPHPGRMETAETASPEYITPDVFVVEHDGALDVVLNDFYVPQIRINGYYAALLTETEDPETKEFLRQKMQQAQWVMAHMERRRKTLKRCARLILAPHLPFFQGTTLCLAPFMQKDAAERMEVHASTLGRCIRGKYLQCRQGTYPLQYFFPRPVDSAGRCSEQAVRVKLAQYMKDEDPHHPLSDQRLSELLLAEDIPAARRTVAKYRELMGIPPAYGRRK